MVGVGEYSVRSMKVTQQTDNDGPTCGLFLLRYAIYIAANPTNWASSIEKQSFTVTQMPALLNKLRTHWSTMTLDGIVLGARDIAPPPHAVERATPDVAVGLVAELQQALDAERAAFAQHRELAGASGQLATHCQEQKAEIARLNAELTTCRAECELLRIDCARSRAVADSSMIDWIGTILSKAGIKIPRAYEDNIVSFIVSRLKQKDLVHRIDEDNIIGGKRQRPQIIGDDCESEDDDSDEVVLEEDPEPLYTRRKRRRPTREDSDKGLRPATAAFGELASPSSSPLSSPSASPAPSSLEYLTDTSPNDQCVECNRVVVSKGVQCTRCERWLHERCCGFKVREVRSDRTWACHHCESGPFRAFLVPGDGRKPVSICEVTWADLTAATCRRANYNIYVTGPRQQNVRVESILTAQKFKGDCIIVRTFGAHLLSLPSNMPTPSWKTLVQRGA